jgi:hypothetical protein
MVPSTAKVNGGHATLLVDTHLRHNGATSGSYMNGHTTGEVPIHEEPFGSKKKMRIAMLGAGISGLNFFKFAEQKLENVERLSVTRRTGMWEERG